MADFGIHFFLCNIFICIIAGIFFAAKHMFRNYLTSQMHYHLWFLFLGLLSVPFIPTHLVAFSRLFAWFGTWRNMFSEDLESIASPAIAPTISGTTRQLNDFALSVSTQTSSMVGFLLCSIWLTGIMAMFLLVIYSRIRLNTIQKSALPLQNKAVRILYNNCLKEIKIKKEIPIYSTAFLKSPIIVGLYNPRIYLPIHLISDFHAAKMRYILLHELQHYRHKDALSNLFMTLIGILYWCNPLVWFALKEMKHDREIACDASVLQLLPESEYPDYGHTLINFAEKISFMSFPFATGISGNLKQMQRRIIHISHYKKPSIFAKIKGFIAFILIGVLLLRLVPMLSTYAACQNQYLWDADSDKIFTIDLSSYFCGYEGSFVLYDLKEDRWSVYHMEQATLRTAPNSTYKIYDALFGLEEGIITPDASYMAWNGSNYPFEAWNKNQNLYSAMQSSVNWYFQELDKQMGLPTIQNYIRNIGYGNQNIYADPSSYWLQSSLKISPIEQVELLIALYHNTFAFAPENIDAIKDSICLFSSEDKNFYGKTGTGCVDGQDINGWFIGFLEVPDNTYFFATHIQSDANATGSKAAEITKAVLSR